MSATIYGETVLTAEDLHWKALRGAVTELQTLQAADGALEPAADRSRAAQLVDAVCEAVAAVSPLLPHDAAYHAALVTDLRRWAAEGFGVPDFLDSLSAFQPSRDRADGRVHLVVFPMYTQNGTPDRRFEAVLIREVWPAWLAAIEAERYDNPMFLGVAFEDFTAGYDSHSAVLFPETVSVRETPSSYTWGAIFCDREAARFRQVSAASVELLGMDLPDEVQGLLDDQDRCQEAFVLWDMVHDRTHSHGDLPFDPFMIRQRQPFWMYGLEELRCDLTAFKAAVQLEAEGLPQARDVQVAVLFDRLFRFPVTGTRTRNYDGLGGQLLFAYLHKHDVVRWTDNRLTIDFERVAPVTQELCARIEKFYRDGIDKPKVVHWLAGHDLVSEFLAPHPGSRWARRDLDWDKQPRELVDDVMADEFPLSMFYEALAKKLRGVVEATKGVTGRIAS